MNLTLAKPRKRFKNGTISERTKGVYLKELQLVQYALEQVASRLSRLEKAHNDNDREMRDVHIQQNRLELRLQRLEETARRSAEE